MTMRKLAVLVAAWLVGATPALALEGLEPTQPLAVVAGAPIEAAASAAAEESAIVSAASADQTSEGERRTDTES
ncbi:MAG: hypothetical protein NZM07_10645 [Elioraea sp.]|nr:hypothetical protein [Elioraea sp.]